MAALMGGFRPIVVTKMTNAPRHLVAFASKTFSQNPLGGDLSKKLIYGGSFNPVHNAHLYIAELAREKAGAEEVVFVPSYNQGKKYKNNSDNFDDRLEMLKLATQANPYFRVSDIEKRIAQEEWKESSSPIDQYGNQRGVTYTFKVTKAINRENNALNGSPMSKITKFFTLFGADSFAKIDQWEESRQFPKLMKFILANRPGKKPVAELLKEVKIAHDPDISVTELNSPSIDISSTLIRQRASEQKPLTGLVPPLVEAYIKSHGLYQDDDSGQSLSLSA